MAYLHTKVTAWENTEFDKKFLPEVERMIESGEISDSEDLIRYLERQGEGCSYEVIPETECRLPGLELFGGSGESLIQQNSDYKVYAVSWTSGGYKGLQIFEKEELASGLREILEDIYCNLRLTEKGNKHWEELTGQILLFADSDLKKATNAIDRLHRMGYLESDYSIAITERILSI